MKDTRMVSKAMNILTGKDGGVVIQVFSDHISKEEVSLYNLLYDMGCSVPELMELFPDSVCITLSDRLARHLMKNLNKMYSDEE